MKAETEKYPVGTEVYYSMEDFKTGKQIIYKGIVKSIVHHNLKIKNKTLNMKFYMVDDGLGLMANSFYTIEELFELKDRLEARECELNEKLAR